MDALITYGGDRVGYCAMRSLAGLGLKVAVADPGRLGLSQLSRFCAGSYLLRRPFGDEDGFVAEVGRILEGCRAGFLLPTQSETEVLAKHRARLPDGVVLPLDSHEKMCMVNDKGLIAEYARKMGARVPEVIEWNTWDELEDRLRVIGSRVVVKLREGYSAKWVFYPEDARQALAACKALAAGYSLSRGCMPVVQKRVEGEGWGVSCLYHKGRKLASFTHQRLRQRPPTGGSSTLRLSARNGVLEDYAERLLDGLNWHGIAMVEFKYDPRTKEAWFMEINPRLWGSINLAVASGVDLVALLYTASAEGPEKAAGMARPQREGVISRWWLGDVSLAVSEARNRNFLKALRLVLPGGADAYDEFRLDDPGATLGAFIRPFFRKAGTAGSGPPAPDAGGDRVRPGAATRLEQPQDGPDAVV